MSSSTAHQLLQKGQKIQIMIDRLGIHGEGVGRFVGLTVFVDGGLPGEEILCRITEVKKTYARGRIDELITPSQHRMEPVCPRFGRCGGCQLMHLDYGAQLKEKRQRVEDALHRIGKLVDVPIAPCVPSPNELHYRNKIQLPARCSHRGMELGLYARQSHDFIAVDRCFIHADVGEEVFQRVRTALQSVQLPTLRHILIRSVKSSDAALVIFVTTDRASSELKQIAEKLLNSVPAVKGVIQNINPTTGNTILGKEWMTLAGLDSIDEVLCGLTFKVSPASFFQVNPLQAEQIYSKALELSQVKGTETVLDSYCGVGTLSLIFARHVKAVIGIECVPEAIADARKNAQNNGITNATFICDLAETSITTVPSIDVALLNPPRKGCQPAFLQALLERRPEKILYLSCDPATLARDLAILKEGGYTVESVTPFDMFPQTAHVETLVSLFRKG